VRESFSFFFLFFFLHFLKKIFISLFFLLSLVIYAGLSDVQMIYLPAGVRHLEQGK
jgi:hypothetical protein